MLDGFYKGPAGRTSSWFSAVPAVQLFAERASAYLS